MFWKTHFFWKIIFFKKKINFFIENPIFFNWKNNFLLKNHLFFEIIFFFEKIFFYWKKNIFLLEKLFILNKNKSIAFVQKIFCFGGIHQSFDSSWLKPNRTNFDQVNHPINSNTWLVTFDRIEDFTQIQTEILFQRHLNSLQVKTINKETGQTKRGKINE